MPPCQYVRILLFLSVLKCNSCTAIVICKEMNTSRACEFNRLAGNVKKNSCNDRLVLRVRISK